MLVVRKRLRPHALDSSDKNIPGYMFGTVQLEGA